MRISVFILALLSVAACTSTTDASYVYDITTSVTMIKALLTNFVNNYNAIKIANVVTAVLGCIEPIPVGDTTIDLGAIWQKIRETVDSWNWEEFKPVEGMIAEIKIFVNNRTTEFQEIHDHIWADEEFIDIIEFLRNAGYPDIYAAFAALYDALTVPPHIRPPTGKPPSSALRSRTVTKDLEPREPPFFTFLQDPPSPIEECLGENLPIDDLLGSGLLQLLGLVQGTLREVAINPALQVFLVKIGETAKGASFRGSRELESVIALVDDLDNVIVENLNILLVDANIPWKELHLSENFLRLIEYIVWGRPFGISSFSDWESWTERMSLRYGHMN